MDYIKELKSTNGSELILEMARLGSQKAMDSIIENLVTFIDKYETRSYKLMDEIGKRDAVNEVIREDLYDEFGHDFSLNKSAHPYLIYMKAISASSKFENIEELRNFFLSKIIHNVSFHGIIRYGNFPFSLLPQTSKDLFYISDGLTSFIFKNKYSYGDYVQPNVDYYLDKRFEDYKIIETETFPSKLREYLSSIVIGEINSFAEQGYSTYNKKNVKYFCLPYLDNVYPVFNMFKKCKVNRKTFYVGNTNNPIKKLEEYKKIKHEQEVNFYKKNVPIELKYFHQICMRVNIVATELHQKNYKSKGGLTHYGIHFLASTIAYINVLKEFFEFNQISEEFFQDKKFDDIFNEHYSVWLPRYNFRSLLIGLIKDVNKDYDYFIQTYPHLDEYVKTYLKDHIIDGEHVPSLSYKEINDLTYQNN